MPVAIEIPISVTPHATAWIEGWGVQPVLDQLLARIRETMPDVRSIEVTLDLPFIEHGTSECIIVAPIRDDPDGDFDDPSGRELDRWFIETFPRAITEHFLVSPGYLPKNER